MKLTKKEQDAFAVIGEAICDAKNAAKAKKDALPTIKDVLANNKEAFAVGITIGKYRFSAVERVELCATEV